MGTHLIGYKHHPVTVAHMYVRAFKRLGHEVIKIGTPWLGLRYSPEYNDPPDVSVPQGEPTWRVNWISDLPNLDGIWSFDQGFRLRGKLQNIPNVLYGTDPHVIDYRVYSREYDYFFSSQKMPDSLWVPLGYDPEYHRMDVPITKEDRPIDVCFIGMSGPGYENRRLGLSMMGILKKRIFQATGLFYEQFRKPYNNSKIAYNWSSSFDIPMRFWEGMAMGCCVLTNKLPFLQELGFIEDQDYVTFNNEHDLVDKTDYLLSSGKWQDIAKSGHETVKDHTYDNRVTAMLNLMEK